MKISQMKMTSFIFLFSALNLVLHPSSSHGATVVVDGVSKWKDPTLNIGDSIIFRHMDHYTLYIFRNKLAFNLCNFTQSTRLSDPTSSSSYSWRPSRLGNFYFSYNNGTGKPCQEGQKLTVKVTLQPSPAPAPAPEISVKPPRSPAVTVAVPPTAGGVVSSSPAFPWPFRPREKAGGPGSSPAPAADGTIAMAPLVPGGNGGSTPFIDSNPAVPLPTGEVDSATIRPLPLPTNSNNALPKVQVVGLLGVVLPLCISISLML